MNQTRKSSFVIFLIVSITAHALGGLWVVLLFQSPYSMDHRLHISMSSRTDVANHHSSNDLSSPLNNQNITPVPTPSTTPPSKLPPILTSKTTAVTAPTPSVDPDVLNSVAKNSPTFSQEIIDHADTPATPNITPTSQPDIEQEPIFDAAYLQNPKPNYPTFAKRLQQQGLVKLRVKVSSEGIAEEIELSESSGFKLLDEAAQKTVKKWRFVPAKRGNQAISSWVNIPILFQLD